VMKEGVLQQVESPDRIYHYPANLFVADFIGNPKMNLLDADVTGRDTVDLGGVKLYMNVPPSNGKVVVGMRPEDVGVLESPSPDTFEFNAYSVLPAGADTTIIAKKNDLEITIKVMGISPIKDYDKIWLKFDPKKINLFDKATGNLLGGEVVRV